jgi:uncharacterized protein RhaS with RHS repeats
VNSVGARLNHVHRRPASRSYTFTDIGNVRYPARLTAPCSLCGSTQQASTYDANGNPTKQIAHDGSVTFIAYGAKARQTERATFPSSYQNTSAPDDRAESSFVAFFCSSNLQEFLCLRPFMTSKPKSWAFPPRIVRASSST